MKDLADAHTAVIAYLGPEGTFCEQAARKFFSNEAATFTPSQSISDVFTVVEKEKATYGVVPLENSLQGSERPTLDLLLQNDLKVRGEVDIRIVHNLIAKAGIKEKDVKVIVSHPQALAQCHRFIEKEFPRCELREASSTAKAVETLKILDNAAAIGTVIAAQKYGMTILLKQIEDNPNNFTRFFVLGSKDAGPTGNDKTSIVFSTRDEPGALYRILRAFARREVNLTKIESRPEWGKPWKYVFYLDFEGHRTEEKSIEALNEMKESCIFVKVLGSYPRAVIDSD